VAINDGSKMSERQMEIGIDGRNVNSSMVDVHIDV